MVKVVAPLFSLRASGTLGNTITFVCGHLARIAQRKEEAEGYVPTGQNEYFMEAIKRWNNLSVGVKDDWRNFARVVKDSKVCISLDYYLTNYQLFLSYYMTWGFNGWPDYPNPGPPPS